MRKNLLLVVLLISSSSIGYAQFQLGFKFSPTISTNRIDSDSETRSFSSDGAGVKFNVGLLADYQLTDNYFFSTGIFLASKQSAFKVSDALGTRTEEYALQYVQIPVTLKLFTNEIALDKRIYFQVGGTMDVNVKEKPKKDSYTYIEDFRLFDSSLIIGVGLEYKVGVSTIVFGGFTYSRGLLNTIDKHLNPDDDLIFKNDYVGLDLGVKF